MLLTLLLSTLLQFPITDTIVSGGQITIAFISDSYSADEYELFKADVKEKTQYIFNTAPFDTLKDCFSVYSIFSDRSFGLYSGAFGVEQLIYCDDIGSIKAYVEDEIEDCDFICVITDTEKYGGAGGEITICTRHRLSNEVLLHEMGHSIGGLGDEYYAGEDFIGEFPNTSLGTTGKWKDVSGSGLHPVLREDGTTAFYTPFETSDSSEYCKMSALGKKFCPVCARAISEKVKVIH